MSDLLLGREELCTNLNLLGPPRKLLQVGRRRPSLGQAEEKGEGDWPCESSSTCRYRSLDARSPVCQHTLWLCRSVHIRCSDSEVWGVLCSCSSSRSGCECTWFNGRGLAGNLWRREGRRMGQERQRSQSVVPGDLALAWCTRQKLWILNCTINLFLPWGRESVSQSLSLALGCLCRGVVMLQVRQNSSRVELRTNKGKHSSWRCCTGPVKGSWADHTNIFYRGVQMECL